MCLYRVSEGPQSDIVRFSILYVCSDCLLPPVAKKAHYTLLTEIVKVLFRELWTGGQYVYNNSTM